MCCKQMYLSHWHYVYVTSERRKEKIEQGTHDEYEDSNICEGLFDLWWDSKWQVNVLWIRCDMLMHSLKYKKNLSFMINGC